MGYSPLTVNLISLDPQYQIKELLNPFFITEWLNRHKFEEDKIFYHYTDLKGLKGILSSRSLWFSHISSLNDPSELVYGKNIITRELDIILKNGLNGAAADLVKSIKSTLNNFGFNIYDTYVACFCANPNILSQWRVYANQGGGFNIGLGLNDLTYYTDEHAQPMYSVILRKIFYDPLEQQKIVSDYLKKFIETARRYINQNKNYSIDLIALQSISTLIEMMICMKENVFYDEQEWRLILIRMANYKAEKLLFRESNNYLTPYFNIYIYNRLDDAEIAVRKKEKEFPLKEINYGPSLDDTRARALIRLFLQNQSTSQSPIYIKKEVKINGPGFNLRST